MGSKRTNKRVGGGVAFARRNRDYSYRLPKKAVRLAIRMALLSKFQDGQALVIDGMPVGEKPQTKPIAALLRSITRPDIGPDTEAGDETTTKSAALRRTLEGRSILIGLPEQNTTLYRSARNIEGVQVAPVAEFNTYDILRQRYLILTREALDALKERAKEPIRRRPALTTPADTAASPEN